MTSSTGNRRTRGGATKADQRERLVEGMTQIAGRYGYREASVARVVEHAGVSRATFYQHFADKEACFLAAFDKAAERVALALERIDSEVAPGQRAPGLLDGLLDNAISRPAAARILLVEARAGGPEVRLAHDRLMLAVETVLEHWLSFPGANGDQLAISGRAILGGVAGILVVRAFRGETAHLGELRNELLAWISSYAVPEGHSRLSLAEWRELGADLVPSARVLKANAGPRKLPRGKSAVAPEMVAVEQRERILAAVAQLAGTKGYTAMTVADIVKAAAVTREAFYEAFKSKEDAFLATQISGLETAISHASAGFFVGENWPERVWGGLEELLGHVALQPDLVYLDVIETYAAGAAAIRRSFDNRKAYHLFLEDGYRQPAAGVLPRLCSEAIGSAILELLRWQVSEGRTEQTLEALPQAVYLALAPFIGPRAAMELVEAKVAAARRDALPLPKRGAEQANGAAKVD